MSITQSTASARVRLAGTGLVVMLALGAAACSSSSKSTSPTSPQATPTSTGTAPPTTVNPAPAAAVTAIMKYEVKNGPKLGTWQVTAVQASKVDPSFVMYRISPASPKDTNVQGGYGFAHLANGAWAVVGFGSDRVGCPPGTKGNASIPPTVISAFGLTCPS